MSTTEDLHKVREIINHNPICMFTVGGAQEALLSWPMTVLKTEDDGEMWFFTASTSSPAAQIGAGTTANLSFSGKSEWLSLHGTAAVITSAPKARELWNEAAAAFFPEGPDSPDLALIRVRPEGAQYWNSPSGGIALALRWAKARLAGTRIDARDSATVDL